MLLGLGGGSEGPAFSYSGLSLGSQDSEYSQLEESVLPLMPPRLVEVSGTGPMTLSSISQSGSSLPEPTESIPTANTGDPSILRDTDASPAVLPAAEDRGPHLFPWSYEFSWKDSQLCFGNDPLEAVGTLDDRLSKVSPGSELALSDSHESPPGLTTHVVLPDEFLALHVAGIGGFMEDLSSIRSSSLLDDINAAGVCDPVAEITAYKLADWIVELLLDDFLRSHPSWQSEGRAAGAPQENTDNASDDQTGEGHRPNREARDISQSLKRKTPGGDGGSEDEDEGFLDRRRKPSSTGKAKESRRWACPFAKWKPEEYKCKVSPKKIKDLKPHIKRMHWREHCDKCWMIYPEDEGKINHFCRQSNSLTKAPPGLMTRKMRDEISKHESSRMSHEEQWRRIYGVLFPGEQCCYNPYVDEATDRDLGKMERYLRSKRVKRIVNEEVSSWEFEQKVQKKITERVRDGLFARISQGYDPNDDDCFTPAQKELREVETGQTCRIEVVGTNKTIIGFHPEPPTGELVLRDQTLGAMPDLMAVQDPLGGIGPVELGSCHLEALDMPFETPLDDNFENAFPYNGSGMDDDQFGMGFYSDRFDDCF